VRGARLGLRQRGTDIAVPATHPLARQAAAARDGAVPLAELGAGPWICGAPGTSCHDWLTFTLRSARLEPRFAHTANEHATQASTVAATRLTTLLGQGKAMNVALTGGFRWGFWVCGMIALLALPATAVLFRRAAAPAPGAGEDTQVREVRR
jgi:hypothetical protein